MGFLKFDTHNYKCFNELKIKKRVGLGSEIEFLGI